MDSTPQGHRAEKRYEGKTYARQTQGHLQSALASLRKPFTPCAIRSERTSGWPVLAWPTSPICSGTPTLRPRRSTQRSTRHICANRLRSSRALQGSRALRHRNATRTACSAKLDRRTPSRSNSYEDGMESWRREWDSNLRRSPQRIDSLQPTRQWVATSENLVHQAFARSLSDTWVTVHSGPPASGQLALASAGESAGRGGNESVIVSDSSSEDPE
jgi:hypothetical protein